MARAFAPDSNDDSAVDLTNDGFAWVNVLSTEAPKQKTFEQVKDQVKDNYMSSERRRLIDELAKKLTDKVNAGEPMTAIEGEAKGKVEKTDPITRKMVPTGLTQAAVGQAFALAKGKAGHSPSADHDSEVVFRVADIIPAAAPSLTETDELTHELAEQLSNQTLGEYTEALKKRFGTSINQAELNAAVGVSEQ
jgi:peptidyl-prolyl cis-trans isomerase D